MNFAELNAKTRPGFRVVCLECGSLSIKLKDPVNAPPDTLVECGRCSVVRGTLADLHALARDGGTLLEF
jgi:hypothetical protein